MQLTTTEQTELVQHEAVIERGLKTFVEVGFALLAIQRKKLYRQEYGNFDDYCKRRWDMSRPRAYQLIDAAKVNRNLSTTVDKLPSTEFETRPLTRLKEPGQQREAWRRAIDTAPEGVVTAAHVKRVVKEIIREGRGQDKPPPFPAGTFAVIYADPPWSYDNSGFDQSAASHYPTMTTDEICDLPVGELCTDDSVLFLWATSPLLDEAFKVIKAWGFTYKASIVWHKNRAPGMGWFVQTEHEFLLIATRGGNAHPLTKPKSVVWSAVERHSQKPEVFHGIIESMYNGPYCELFARNTRADWSSWGHEIGRECEVQGSGEKDAAIRQQTLGLGQGLGQGEMDSFLPGFVPHHSGDLLLRG